ncbi:MAG: HAD hydrolase-like protein, partial [Clostridia bacterium]|nr:HAD hydrolase-like protein [Clostridia bacterium]
KLEDACILLGRGVDYIATNPDLVCPTWYGSVPDCGSIAHILRTATGRYPEFIGKPKPEMPLLAMEKAGFGKGETVVIGDRIYTDVACGIHAGIDAILVLSGETRLEDVEKNEVKPTAIYRDIKAILDEMKA